MGVENIVADEFVRCAMKSIGAALHAYADNIRSMAMLSRHVRGKHLENSVL